MNTALRTSVSDLNRSLQKALANSNLDQKIAMRANQAGNAIATANRPDYPEIKSSVSKSGPWSWEISLIAPSLWASTFGSRNLQGRQFTTRVDLSNLAETSGLRGEA